ncbi:MAG: phage tail sheath family protein [Butyricicoccus sp.]|nr:phage tail sheath family protein [Butyricicoccus sp.]
MSYRHGVYNSEIPTSLTAPITGSAGLQVVFGTAPIHLAEDPYKAVNTPVLCYSFAECVAALGYSTEFKKFTLCQSMYASFQMYNIAPIVLINVLDPSKDSHKQENEETEIGVVGGQAVYEKQYVLLDTLTVKNGETELFADADYVAEHNDDGYVVLTLLNTENEIKALTVGSVSLNPDGVTKEDILGSYDVKTGKETGLELVRTIFPKFGMAPGQLIAPGFSKNSVVAAALQAKTASINGNFDCTCVLDIDCTSEGAVVYTDAKAQKEKMGAISADATSLWPMVKVGDYILHYSAVYGAHVAQLDAENGDVPYESPSNLSLPITATVLDDGTEVLLDQEQANDMLNAYGIVTAINFNGFKVWGNNTCAYPSTSDPKDRWISVRRFFHWDGNNFILTYFQKVDRPGNKRLIKDIVDSQNIVGNGYVNREYCAGYRMDFLEEENPATNLINGHLTTHTYLAPYIPTEFLENIREYDVAALTNALTGGD